MTSKINFSKIGKLGFGYMRLPRINGKFDEPQINKMADTFLENGGTYFDAAYVYEGAEVALCNSVVKRHARDKVQIASKLPIGMIKPELTAEMLFNTTLERLGTDYVDFYLLHGINSRGNEQSEKLGAWDFVAERKAKGQIRHIGFSFHGDNEELDEILKKHPETEFVQLQINYSDWYNPDTNAKRLHEIAVSHNVPIIIMEPLLGGKLASKDSPMAKFLNALNPNASLASYAFRFTASLENVFVTLSGMSNFEQMEDNLKTYADLKPLTSEEFAAIEKGVEALLAVPGVGCTECNYCKDCPSNIPIPLLIGLYNEYLTYKTTTNLQGGYAWRTNGRGKAKDCTACGACENVCSQRLEIVDIIKKVSGMFD